MRPRVGVPPPSDSYPEVLSEVVRALLADGQEAGAAALAPISYKRRPIAGRRSPSRAIQGQIFRRDRFCCRYCGAQLIPTPIMQLISGLYPQDFPYHDHWKGGQTHPAVISRSPVVDHVDPGSVGGDWLDPANVVTACWPCNSRKADIALERLGWELAPISDSDWDGLTSYYPALWHAAGEPKPHYHRDWMKALGCSVEGLDVA